ncbi:MAG TPA: carboxypeptidase-like regulatory domain-containing protein, partial [Gemmatimonadaceae bacterium]
MRPTELVAQAVGTVTGRVSGPDGSAINGASVTVAGTSLATTTDRSGSFKLSGVAVGRQTIAIRAIGLRPA